MSGTAPIPGLDPVLVRRFEAVEGEIAWRKVPSHRGRTRTSARIAHLHDEEARVELEENGRAAQLTVESGPVGALVVLLETVRRAAPPALGTFPAGVRPEFPGGAIVATWGARSPPKADALRLTDLAELARYALV